MKSASRRRFLKTAGVSLGAAALAPSIRLRADAASERRYRAVIIGRTGGGDYGHGFDTVCNGLENVVVAAVADADPTGLNRAAERSGAQRKYRDYRTMLDKEKPDLVVIGPRQPDCHRAMALAAIAAGAHVYMEKPITETVADADAIVQSLDASDCKMAIGHTRRYTSDFVRIRALLAQGFLGVVREVHTQGKQDSRAGGEDLIVLGTHDFDIFRFYFGDPAWSFAQVTVDGRDITKSDVHRGREPYRVAGDTIRAMFAFPKNVEVTWNSFKSDDHWNTPFGNRERWGFTIFGTQRIIGYQSGFGFAYLDSPFDLHENAHWRPLPAPKNRSLAPHETHPIRNLIHAIETGGKPLCDARDGRWAVEMVAAVYQSQFRRGRVALPLEDRSDPLTPIG